MPSSHNRLNRKGLEQQENGKESTIPLIYCSKAVVRNHKSRFSFLHTSVVILSLLNLYVKISCKLFMPIVEYKKVIWYNVTLNYNKHIRPIHIWKHPHRFSLNVCFWRWNYKMKRSPFYTKWQLKIF